MADVRIIEQWVRAPAAAPTQRRSVMVVADRWSEQRVLMRAFAASADRARPTITLRDRAYAISPAGTDGQGPWGIHVPEGDDAEQLRLELVEAAKRKPNARVSSSTAVASTSAGAPQLPAGDKGAWARAQPRRSSSGSDLGRRTALGFASALAPVAPSSSRRQQATSASSSSIFGKTVPTGFLLHPWEREVLDVLARKRRIRDREVAALAGRGDGHVLMQRLIAKLHRVGIDIILAESDGYRLRHHPNHTE